MIDSVGGSRSFRMLGGTEGSLPSSKPAPTSTNATSRSTFEPAQTIGPGGCIPPNAKPFPMPSIPSQPSVNPIQMLLAVLMQLSMAMLKMFMNPGGVTNQPPKAFID